MKQTIIALLLLGLATTACNTKKTDDNIPPELESVLIPLEQADSLIYNYHHYRMHQMQDSNGTTPSLGHSAFMLNAKALREYLNSDTNYATLNIYLAKNSSSPVDTDFTLVYIGAIDSAGVSVEKAIRKVNDPHQQYMMDMAMPCPKCDRIRLYSNQNAEQKQ